MNAPSSAPASRSAVRRTFEIAARLGVGTGALGTAMALLGGLHWALDLASPFALPIGAAAAAGALSALPLRRFRTAALGLFAVGYSLAAVVPVLTAPTEPSGAAGGRRDLRIVHLNVQMDSGAHDAVGSYLASSDADVIALLEVDDGWVRALEPRLAAWPHRHLEPSGDFFGIALYSRFPIRGVSVRTASPGRLPVLTATVIPDDVPPIPFVLLHVYPPMGEAWIEANGAVLALASSLDEARDERAVVCGDFNGTPWSRSVLDFLDRTGLRPATVGHGWLGTWPAWVPGAVLRLPIDHCLVGRSVASREARVGPDLGSDHLPLLVTLGL